MGEKQTFSLSKRPDNAFVQQELQDKLLEEAGASGHTFTKLDLTSF